MTTDVEQYRMQVALEIAHKAHEGQFRKDNITPFISHPLAVMHRLRRAGVTDTSILAAAMLHDTIEDTPVTHRYIAAKLGRVIADMVEEVTDDPALKFKERRQAQIDKAPSLSKGARWIKLADKTENLFDMGDSTMTVPQQWEYVLQAEKVVQAFADSQELKEMPEIRLMRDFSQVASNLKESLYFRGSGPMEHAP